MSENVDWARVIALLDDLYTAADGLERLFPGRKFTLDGHLVGSIGEVVAAYMFDLDLNPASTHGHDARARDGRQVEIKLTQGRGVAIRHEPEHLIVLHRPIGGPIRVVFNGPGPVAWAAAGAMQKNGQRPISLSRLTALSNDVTKQDRLPVLRPPPV
ncbi:hypothetical protein [Paracoccus sp. PARArs4]|uniref:DUF6998 domain-containing protein n=1 Tax=Paracoccus sp. PARArs4 TaxID=2853442 RepID=UPI0024A6EE57|nr:hypothetical protein [Paracoccus sp. PARArs4]